MSLRPLLAVMLDRGGSKGLPGKNIRPLAGLPLIAHSTRLARLCPAIDRCIVSTDSEEIAEGAGARSAEVPFISPAEFGQNHTGMRAVLQHALRVMERRGKTLFGFPGCSYNPRLLFVSLLWCLGDSRCQSFCRAGYWDALVRFMDGEQ